MGICVFNPQRSSHRRIGYPRYDVLPTLTNDALIPPSAARRASEWVGSLGSTRWRFELVLLRARIPNTSSTHPTCLRFRSSPARGRSAGPSSSDQLSAFSFGRPILGLEIGPPVRYIRWCTFVRIWLFDNPTTFNRRCPACYRCAGMVRKGFGHLLCEAPPRAVPANVPDTFLDTPFRTGPMCAAVTAS